MYSLIDNSHFVAAVTYNVIMLYIYVPCIFATLTYVHIQCTCTLYTICCNSFLSMYMC